MTEQPTNTPSDSPFWRFSLAFYRQAGVAAACLALQDDCGVDVNLRQFLLWLAANGRQVSLENIKELDQTVRSWRDLTIIPVREVRRKLKAAPPLVVSEAQIDCFVEAARSVVELVHSSGTFWSEALGLARRVIQV